MQSGSFEGVFLGLGGPNALARPPKWTLLAGFAISIWPRFDEKSRNIGSLGIQKTELPLKSGLFLATKVKTLSAAICRSTPHVYFGK